MGAGAIIGGAAIAGGLGYMGSKEQADAVSGSTNDALNAEKYRTEQAIALSSPARQVGNQAMNVLGSYFIPGYSGLDISGQPGGYNDLGGYGQQFFGGGGLDALIGTFGNDLSKMSDHDIKDLIGTWMYDYRGLDDVGGYRRPGSANVEWDDWKGSSEDAMKINQIAGFGLGGGPGADTVEKIFGDLFSSKKSLKEVNWDPGGQDLVNLVINNKHNLGALKEQYGQGGRLAPIGLDQLNQQFQNLPGVQFQQGQADKAVANSALMHGVSGNSLADLSQRNMNLAYNTMVPGLMNLAGYGVQGGGMGANAAASNQSPQLLAGGGYGQANAIGGQYSSMNNAIQGGLQNYMTYKNLNQTPVNPNSGGQYPPPTNASPYPNAAIGNV